MSKPEYLSMPDPCEHITRLDIIRANLHGMETPYCFICATEEYLSVMNLQDTEIGEVIADIAKERNRETYE